MDVPHEEIVFALDAIQDPVSLFEPIYNDGGDPIFVVDQLSDEKNKDIHWIEEIALKEGMRRLNEREKLILRKTIFSRENSNGGCRRNWDFPSTSFPFRKSCNQTNE